MHPSRLVGSAGAVAAVVLLGGCTSSGTEPGLRPGPSASAGQELPGTGAVAAAICAATLELDGRTYLGHGELRRQPEVTGRRLDGVVPGCDDTPNRGDPEPDRSVQAEELADLPAEVAVLLDGSVYVRDGEELPPEVRVWFDSPTCDHAGELGLTGTWLAVRGPHEPRFDGDIRPPYRIEVEVTTGAPSYAGTRLWIHVGPAADPLLGAADVRDTLWEGGVVRASVRCDSDRFVATAVRSAG
ncbi:hypothetical protein QWY28_18985 [Nocardioides sp. SOB77]|uniref:Lipoprotein n=1 Tax=Nocardioides oceani TaxID=3058369 RepID=A0ABT8FK38_9ACTN|nr:hypothetical protein [Nocardioides oceani]MDN4175057.1 hypothetical protein [Nocardioides oceani]